MKLFRSIIHPLAAMLLLTFGSLPGQTVTDTASLVSAIAAANAAPNSPSTITLTAGTYALSENLPSLAADRLTLRGPTSGAPAILDADALASGVIFNVGADQVSISNLTLQNARTHAVSIQPGADSGRIEKCTFANPANPPPAAAAISGDGCADWVITANTISRIVGGTSTAEPAINFYGGASGTEVSSNRILNCDSAIAFGAAPRSKPVINAQPQNRTVTAGQTASFTVTATGKAPLKYQWRRNGTALSGANSASYTTPATTAADNGAKFSVVVSNSGGSVTSSNATLTVTAALDTQAPSVPTGLSSSAIDSSSFTLSWTASTDNVGVTGYEVFKDGVSIGTTTSAQMIVSGLNPASTYAMNVRARDAVPNWSAQSNAIDVTTLSAGARSLNFPRIPWEGGAAYWSRFSKAKASGWSNPTFFPISVFLGKADPSHVASLKDAGVNTYMAVEHDPEIFPISNITSQGMFAMADIDPDEKDGKAEGWTPEEVGDDNGVVAWFISDECEMGMSCSGDQYQELAQQKAWVYRVMSYNDGRFWHANFGNGILRTFWSEDTMNEQVQLMSSASADKYTYTSDSVATIIDGVHDAPDWPNGVPVARAYSYGWQADQMRRFQNPADLRPIWTFVETAMPFLFDEDNPRTIQPDQIEGAVWSALIHEARGIAYFQHNNNNLCGMYSIVDCADVHDKVKAINAAVKALAPVLNTQSYYNSTREVNGFTYYYFTFNNGTDTMVKTYNGSVYIIAGIGMQQSPGSKTFAIPTGVRGTSVEVVGENRTLPVTDGKFTDSFAYEYSHHVYRITL